MFSWLKHKYMLRKGYTFSPKYNIYVNYEQHRAVDGRSVRYAFRKLYKNKLKPHAYGIWTIYSHLRLSNDILDTILRPEFDLNKAYILAKAQLKDY